MRKQYLCSTPLIAVEVNCTCKINISFVRSNVHKTYLPTYII